MRAMTSVHCAVNNDTRINTDFFNSVLCCSTSKGKKKKVRHSVSFPKETLLSEIWEIGSDFSDNSSHLYRAALIYLSLLINEAFKDTSQSCSILGTHLCALNVKQHWHLSIVTDKMSQKEWTWKTRTMRNDESWWNVCSKSKIRVRGVLQIPSQKCNQKDHSTWDKIRQKCTTVI